MKNLDTLPYEQVSSIDEVVGNFRALEEKLRRSEYDALRNFNKTYLIITKNVRARMRQAVFADPKFLETFDARFAKYYLEAFDKYLKGTVAPPAWCKAFEESKKGKLPPVAIMALGVNAHVNNDIAQVLSDCKAEKRHYGDYKKINRIIRDSIYEVIDGLDNRKMALDPKNFLLKRFYKAVMATLIISWRRKAWHNYQNLLKGDAGIKDIENFAHAKAKQLVRLPL